MTTTTTTNARWRTAGHAFATASIALTCVSLAIAGFARCADFESALDQFDRQFSALDQANYATVMADSPRAGDLSRAGLAQKASAALARVIDISSNNGARGGWRSPVAAVTTIAVGPFGAEALDSAYMTYVDQTTHGADGIGRDAALRVVDVARRYVVQQTTTLHRAAESGMMRALVLLAATSGGLMIIAAVLAFRGGSASEPRGRAQRPVAGLARAYDIVIRVTADGTIGELDGACEAVLGVQADQVIGTKMTALAHASEADNLGRFLTACRTNAANADALEIRGVRGGYVWYRIEPLENRRRTDASHGALVFRIADVSQRRETEEKLRQSSEMLRTLTEASPLAITIEDARGHVKLWNPACAAMFGWPSDDVVGAANPTVPPDCRADYENLRKQVLQGHTFAVLETERAAHDGRLLQVSASAAPLRDARGRTWGVMEVLTDMTERKVLSAQLLQAQKMEGIGRLAGGIAHDFNNLLTAILGQSSMLLRAPQVAAAGSTPIDGGSGPSLGDGIEQIKRAAERASHLTSQLLAFSRNQTMQPVDLDLNTTIVDMHEMLQRMIGEDIDLRTVPGDGIALVKADPTQITQVLINLVVNARDAMPEGGKLTIETTNVVLDEVYARRRMAVVPGTYVMLAVSDSGAGMDKETQARIFEPFFTTKTREKGTGLGLATVYGIVKQSGGYIWCYSEPQLGTSFKIYFPAARQTEIASIQDSAPLPAHVEAAPLTAAPETTFDDTDGAETVLLVEDEEMVRTLVRQVLTWYGYKVLDAHNGEAAIRVAEQYSAPIDLLVTDLVMPGMSALDMVQQIVPKRLGIRVLYMSGYTDHAVVRHHLLHPDIPFIQKPFAPDRLAHKVRQVLDGPIPTPEQLQTHADAIGMAARAASS